MIRLEQYSEGLKVQTHRQALQTDLTRKRQLIRRISQGLQELDHEAESDEEAIRSTDAIEKDGSDRDSKSGINDTWTHGSYAPARPSSGGLHTDMGDSNNIDSTTYIAASALRLRRPMHQDTATIDRGNASGSSISPPSAPTPATVLLQPEKTGVSADPALSSSETLLDHQRAEQEALTESLLTMARALKQSTTQFQSTLESDKDLLGRAGEGLDKNTTGMDIAGRRMGQLRRRMQGWAWWRHISMYVWIALLYVALFAVFALPKLRL